MFFISLQFQIEMMAKKYFYITLLLGFFFTLSISAQEAKPQSKLQETTVIEGLNLYPNPVSNGKVYISSKNDLDKNIIIFDVLGKKVLQTTMTSKELNISNLSPGVYIIKIDEEQATATRKLIVR
jgi:Secretion system C-terminal sorting domain